MISNECLSTFEGMLELKVKSQLGRLDKDIEAARRRAAAKGLLKSGYMINDIKELCINVLESRVNYIFKILHDIPFKYSRRLGASISQISLRYFPLDLGELYARLDAIIRLANGEHARDSVMKEVVEANNAEIERFHLLLDQFILSLKSKRLSIIRRISVHPVWSAVIAGILLAAILMIKDNILNYFIAIYHKILRIF